MLFVLAVLIGCVAGLRTMLAPAAVSWAAHGGWLNLSQTWLAFMGYAYTPYVLTVLAAVELVTDQLPSTPSRKVPVQFAARVVSGTLSGACLGAGGGAPFSGAIGGAIGAVIGTLGGAALRHHLAVRAGSDRPAALAEDALAILAAIVILAAAA
jgi:uncharacterized membrane protein